MAVKTHRIVVRKKRGQGDKQTYRIKLDASGTGEMVNVEVVFPGKRPITQVYQFPAGMLEGKRSILFRCLGRDVHWLAGLKPVLLKNGKENSWDDVVIPMAGKTIEGIPVPVRMDAPLEFYFRRGNKYFFRHRGGKAILHTDQSLTLSIGDMVRIKY